MKNAQTKGLHKPRDWVSEMVPVGKINFYHDSVEYKGKVAGTENQIVALIDRTEHTFVLLSPYVMLTPKIKEAVLRAIRVRGVKFLFYTASPQATDVPDSALAFERQAPELQQFGSEIFQHQGPKMMHAKLAVSDNKTVLLMTHNVDPVSEYLNLESILEFENVSNSPFLHSVEDFITQIKSESKLLTDPTPTSLSKDLMTCSYIWASRIWPKMPESVR